jgi:hypothetical protein
VDLEKKSHFFFDSAATPCFSIPRMKKASFTTTIVATCAVAVISTMASVAQTFPMNQPGTHVAPKINLSASKGEYKKFSLIDATVSPTASSTVSATVAVAKISGTGYYATATATTASTTVDKKSVKKGKITSKDLLALILGTTVDLKNYELVWVSVDGSILDGSDYVFGAREKKTDKITYRLPARDPDTGALVKNAKGTGIEAGGFMELLTEKKALKSGALLQKGYGYVFFGIVSPTPQALGIEGVTTLATYGQASVTFQEEVTYGATGDVTVNKKARVKSVSGVATGN